MKNKLFLATLIVASFIFAVPPCAAETTNESTTDSTIKCTGYVTADVLNVRNKPSTNGKVVSKLNFNEKVVYERVNDEWVKVGNNKYISADFISNEKLKYELYGVPIVTNFKSYMDYRCITDYSSAQYELQQYFAHTGDYGIRMIGDRYCVAIGSAYTTQIGQLFDLVLANGTVIPCVLADAKADCDTDWTGSYTVANNCASEFIIDGDYLDDNISTMGNTSYACEEWDSPIVEIRVYEINIFD